MLSEIVPISDFWFPKSDWPQSILIVDFNLTPVLHKSRVRKSNVRLGSIDFFFPVRWVRCRSIVELGPWFEFEWVRLGSIYYAGSMISVELCASIFCVSFSNVKIILNNPNPTSSLWLLPGKDVYFNVSILTLFVYIFIACVTDEAKPQYRLYRGFVSSVTQPSFSLSTFTLFAYVFIIINSKKRIF